MRVQRAAPIAHESPTGSSRSTRALTGRRRPRRWQASAPHEGLDVGSDGTLRQGPGSAQAQAQAPERRPTEAQAPERRPTEGYSARHDALVGPDGTGGRRSPADAAAVCRPAAPSASACPTLSHSHLPSPRLPPCAPTHLSPPLPPRPRSWRPFTPPLITPLASHSHLAPRPRSWRSG